jgi:hypothetical protein
MPEDVREVEDLVHDTTYTRSTDDPGVLAAPLRSLFGRENNTTTALPLFVIRQPHQFWPAAIFKPLLVGQYLESSFHLSLEAFVPVRADV